MRAGELPRAEIVLLAGGLLNFLVPLRAIAAIIAWRRWRCLAVPDRLSAYGCAAALIVVGVVAHRMRVRDTAARHALLQAPMAVGLYASTHDPLAPATCLCSSLPVDRPIRWGGSRR